MASFFFRLPFFFFFFIKIEALSQTLKIFLISSVIIPQLSFSMFRGLGRHKQNKKKCFLFRLFHGSIHLVTFSKYWFSFTHTHTERERERVRERVQLCLRGLYVEEVLSATGAMMRFEIYGRHALMPMESRIGHLRRLSCLDRICLPRCSASASSTIFFHADGRSRNWFLFQNLANHQENHCRIGPSICLLDTMGKIQ